MPDTGGVRQGGTRGVKLGTRNQTLRREVGATVIPNLSGNLSSPLFRAETAEIKLFEQGQLLNWNLAD
jgi:hypothetical protein